MRWSPSGDKLASASYDTTVSLLDFKTGKVFYTGKTSGESNLFEKTENVITELYRSNLFCMLHLDKNEMQKIQRTRINFKNASRVAQFRS